MSASGRRASSNSRSRSRRPRPDHHDFDFDRGLRGDAMDVDRDDSEHENISIEEEFLSDDARRAEVDPRRRQRSTSRPRGGRGAVAQRGRSTDERAPRGRGRGGNARGGRGRGRGRGRGGRGGGIPLPRPGNNPGASNDSDEEDGDSIRGSSSDEDGDGDSIDDSSSSDSDDDGNGAGGGGAAAAAAPPAPVIVEEYDMVQDSILQHSPLAREVTKQRGFHRMAKPPLTTKYTADPLLGCRLSPAAFPTSESDRKHYLEAVPPKIFWQVIIENASILAKLPSLPKGNAAAVIDYIGDVSVLVDYSGEYAQGKPVSSAQEDQICEQFGRINTLIWDFYIHAKQPERTDRKSYTKLKTTTWVLIQAIHKLAIEKFASAFPRSCHTLFLDVYNNYTLGEFVSCDLDAGYVINSKAAGSPAPSQQDEPRLTIASAWQYLRRANEHHFIGSNATQSEQVNGTDYPLHESTTVISQPDRATLKGQKAANGQGESSTAPRAFSNKVTLESVFKRDDPARKVLFRDLPLDTFLHILVDVHMLWINLEWTPVAEMLILLLWYHFSRFVVDAPQMRRLINVLEHAKRKPIRLPLDNGKHILFKPLSRRFMRDMSLIFVNQLETIRLYYQLSGKVLVRHPRAPQVALAAFAALQQQHQEKKQQEAQQQKQQQSAPAPRSVPSLPVNGAFKPIGFFDTLLHPECKQFLPSIRFLCKSDDILVQCMRCSDKEIEGVDTSAANKHYYERFIRTALIPGSMDAIIGKMPGMIPKPSIVIELSNNTLLAPIGELSFQTNAPVTVLALLRPNMAYRTHLTNPKHARLALQAYDCMLTSMMTTAGIKIKRIVNQSHSTFYAATSSSTHSRQSTESDTLDAAVDKLKSALLGELSDLSVEDLSLLADVQLKLGSTVSNYGKQRPIGDLVKLFKKLKIRKQRRLAGQEEAGILPEQSRSHDHLPIENATDIGRIFITCTDAFQYYICLEKERVRWPSGVRPWPRIIKVRGENWVFDYEADFFLRTTDPMEALHAWYITCVYKFGQEYEFTSGFLCAFERLLGQIYRKVLFDTG